MLLIGLTGGIGSGKSTVAKCFAALGVDIIDTDVIAREITKSRSAVLKKIRTHFGQSLIKKNGELNRKKLGEIIFTNPGERIWLEKLLHPLIYKQVRAKLKKTNSPYVILVVPLLFETKTKEFREIVDRILVVDALLKYRLARLVKREHISRNAAQARIRSQITQSQRLKRADDTLINNNSLVALQKKVKKIHLIYTKIACE